ncbi:MAG: hypothetical protein K0Q55_1441 [Verrucomicrobia bacterium]|jgi:hypothetical protein|nr:hypothetical protein [Verrucomicrobiota bacterium]
MQTELGHYVGWVVGIKADQQMGVVISDNCVAGQLYSKWAAVVRTLDGKEKIYRLAQLQMLPLVAEAQAFRDSAMVKFPGLYIV